MKILVTGANGYLGQGIVKQLIEDGMQVIATDICSDGIDERADIRCVNLFQVENPFSYFGEPDILLHLAWRDGFVHNSFCHFEDLPKHITFLEKMAKSHLKRIGVMGSMHEIGFYEGSINEATPCNPMNYYGIAKDTLRKAAILLCKNYGVDYQWLRGFYIVGNGENGSSIFSKLIKENRMGKLEFPFTLGQNQYDFINYKDFCLYTAAAIEQNEINGIINICSGFPQKLADRAEQFILENRLNIHLNYGAYPDRPYDSKALWGNSEKIMHIMKNREKRYAAE